MRNNGTVTQREYALPEGVAIISKTDEKGRITWVNQDFIDSSGYAESELIGQPHNLLRHPDMPTEAFRDLWETVKSGRPWSGLVKNRRKDGDHYWVRASVTPLVEGGFMSIRQRPGRDEVSAAEALYRQMRSYAGIHLYRGGVYTDRLSLAWAKWAGNLRVAQRIWAMVAFVVILLLALGLSSSMVIEQDMASLKSVYEDRAVPLRDLAKIQILLQENTAEVLRGYQHAPGSFTAAMHDHPAAVHTDNIDRNRAEIDRLWQAYAATALTPEEKVLADAFVAKRSEYVRTYLLPAADEIRSGKFGAPPLLAFLQASRGAGAETRVLMEKLLALQADVAKSEYEAAVARYAEVRQIKFIVGGVTLLALLLSATLLVRAIARPLRAVSDAAQSIASGRLATALPASRGDEIGDMVVQLTRMRDNLFEMVYALRRNAGGLAESAGELRDSSGIAARSAEHQSNSASSMAAAVEQMSVSIDQVGEHARDAHAVAQESGAASRQGGAVILKAAAGMRLIAAAVTASADTIRMLEGYSSEISAIVNVIKEIADQTNLLALNAAIEAARAGEQGRGFAVVADEVRKLAERTSSSTQQIAGMIERIQSGAQKAVVEMEASVVQVGEGVRTAQAAGDSMTGIQTGTERVTRSVDDIVLALKEQSIAAQEIAQNVEKIAQVCEENSAVAQQTAAAALRLNEMASTLRTDSGRFQV
jgi:PAS domain S-box-containing protein